MKQVSYLLTNERYVGDLLMRKYYTPPMLPLRAKKNRGEEDMFLCEGAHEAIIPKEDYLAVQEMRRERSEKFPVHPFFRAYHFSSILFIYKERQTLKIKVNGGNGMIAEIDNEMATLSKQNSTFSDLFLKGVIDSVLYFEKTDRLKNRMAELRERRQSPTRAGRTARRSTARAMKRARMLSS